MVRVAVEHRGHRIPAERLLETAGSEIGKDLGRLAGHGPGDRRVVQHRDALRCPKASERGLELQRLVHRLVHEVLDDLLAPWPERAAAESAGEALHAGDADAENLVALAVEDLHADVPEDATDLILLARFEVVIPEDPDGRDPDGVRQLPDE